MTKRETVSLAFMQMAVDKHYDLVYTPEYAAVCEAWTEDFATKPICEHGNIQSDCLECEISLLRAAERTALIKAQMLQLQLNSCTCQKAK